MKILDINIMRIASFDVGSKNLSFVILENKKIISWHNLNISSSNSVCESLVYELDKHIELFNECAHIVIEKQPSKNNKMRIIEGLLNAYFVIKGKCSSDSNVSKVVVYSAKHKLNSMIKNMKDFNGKDGYNNRKKLSVKITENYVHENETQEFIQIFENSKKKDDLADCLLQGLKYLDIEYIKDETSNEIIKNLLENRKIIARKPTEKQLSKRNGLSKSNIKFLLCAYNQANHDENIQAYINSYKALYNSILKQFNSIEECLKFTFNSMS